MTLSVKGKREVSHNLEIIIGTFTDGRLTPSNNDRSQLDMCSAERVDSLR